MTTAPEVSVVIPVYNEEGILDASVRELARGLAAMRVRYEIWIAENGSRDATAALAAALAAELEGVETFSIGSPGHGDYGAALREGIARARGEFVICEEIDLCDLDFHARALERLRAGAADLVIGSKAMRGAHDRRPLGRRVATRVYNGLLRVTLGFRGTDTHGLKAFRRSVVAPVAARCVVNHDVFASELVIRAQREGVRTLEIPVSLAEKRAPSVHLTRRVPKVLKSLFRLMISIHLGVDPSRRR
ncbi:MAG: glycosyltransferase family 2 protein [Myxococcales bacterium]|nr:glycosyltransferase family 2 protein [Myxococcales bacterium]MCB9749739.1 glycosyltransferase family 2 protein [Myxococcales bacterium]